MRVRTDAFLGGRLNVLQPEHGYRAGADPVILAASVTAREGDRVLELGTGAGVALLCLGVRVTGVSLTGVERNPDLAVFARKNAEANEIPAEIVTADLRLLPGAVRATSFDHVMMNPPFFNRNDGSVAADVHREEGRGQKTPLADWIEVGLRRLKPGGVLAMIQRTERLPETLAHIGARMGNVAVRPLAAREGRIAKLMLLRGEKGSRGPFRLLPPHILHEGSRHDTDRDSYTPASQEILRSGQALSW